MEKFIPVFEPALNGNEEKYLLECVRSGWISSLGSFITDFEQRFADFCGNVGIDLSSVYTPGALDRIYEVKLTETTYDFSNVILFWTISGGLSVIAALFVWNAEKRARGVQ